jgi:hypothetical protein
MAVRNLLVLNKTNHLMDTETTTIKGPRIFFNFIEVPFDRLAESGGLIRKLKTGEIHGFVLKNLLSKEEVTDVLKALKEPLDQEAMNTPYGQMYPAPFAIVTDSEERLDAYYDKIEMLHRRIDQDTALRLVRDRIQSFFNSVAEDFKVSVPINKVKALPVSEGSYRLFYKDKGGLFVHCGNLFQQQSEHYYSLLANDIDKADQLSFFMNLQNSEAGGELTIYNMLWKDVVGKATPEENESVIDVNGNTVYLRDVEQFTVKPLPGDVLVFAGGPIWHRVEDIRGETPRITYGGFINYSTDGKELFYWS